MTNRKIILRFDDICETMNWEQWYKAKQLLDNTGVKALLGIIPECKDKDLSIDTPKSDYWQYILALQKEGYTIAMHGFNHVFDIQSHGIVTRKKHSEFAGHAYEEQYQRIKRGKDVLNRHGIETDVFFTPAHSYDDNTLKALYANGFRFISDGLSKKPYMRCGIICIPCRDAGVPKIKKSGFYTVVLHAHEWVRPEKSKAWDDLQRVCYIFKNDIVSFDDYKQTQLGNSLIQSFDEKMFFLWRYFVKPKVSKIRQIIIPFIQSK